MSVKIQYIKFGQAVQVGSASVTSVDCTRHKHVEVTYFPEHFSYEIKSPKDKIVVHNTNVQWARPYAIEAVKNTEVTENAEGPAASRSRTLGTRKAK